MPTRPRPTNAKIGRHTGEDPSSSPRTTDWRSEIGVKRRETKRFTGLTTSDNEYYVILASCTHTTKNQTQTSILTLVDD
jgi:nitrite reductase/ring-hydroxylating ferredoxin subunit